MSSLKPLKIGPLTARLPIIQGGMGVGISLSGLAGTVAREGGIGIISTAQIGYREPDFKENPLQANLRAIGAELQKAREIACGGIVGFNIMVATRQYAFYVKEAVKAGADLIISGAGLPISLPEYVKGSETKIAPIVSSLKSAMVICKVWDRKYHTAPDLVVVEGPLAGGHLGFSPEQLKELGADSLCTAQTYHQEAYDREVKEIIGLVKSYGEKYQKEIPVVTAGGIYTHEDVLHQLKLGASGVQVGTRFVTTEECDASRAYKETYLKAGQEEIVITKSPVGMPGRAINNEFLKKISQSRKPPRRCYGCLEHCQRDQIPYCITEALINAVRGNTEEGLLFCGSNAYRAEKIETVSQVMRELAGE